MSISLAISEVRAILLASQFRYTTEAERPLWGAALKVDTEWVAFNRAYNKYTSNPQAPTFVELRIRLKALKEAIRLFDKALAKSDSK